MLIFFKYHIKTSFCQSKCYCNSKTIMIFLHYKMCLKECFEISFTNLMSNIVLSYCYPVHLL